MFQHVIKHLKPHLKPQNMDPMLCRRRELLFQHCTFRARWQMLGVHHFSQDHFKIQNTI